MRQLEEINSQIELLEKELQNVKGTKTEVYTRIVGYHRDINNWNKGKREEYNYRMPFDINEKAIFEKSDKICCLDLDDDVVEKNNEEQLDAGISKYALFTSVYCHNCPPVKNYMEAMDLKGENIDVSTDLGLEIARKYDVISTPTVVLFDEKEQVINKLHNLDDIKKILK